MIMLGNLSIEDMQKRSGVTFPEELVEFMTPRWQQKAEEVGPDQWHCFDIPFVLLCGDMKTAVEINTQLSPMSKDFKEPLSISLTK